MIFHRPLWKTQNYVLRIDIACRGGRYIKVILKYTELDIDTYRLNGYIAFQPAILL